MVDLDFTNLLTGTIAFGLAATGAPVRQLLTAELLLVAAAMLLFPEGPAVYEHTLPDLAQFTLLGLLVREPLRTDSRFTNSVSNALTDVFSIWTTTGLDPDVPFTVHKPSTTDRDASTRD